jgi:hypothetical protein
MKTAIPKIPRKIKRGLGTRNRGIKGYSTRFWYRIFFRASMSGKCWKSSGRYMITADLSVRYANVGVRNAEK